jgi:hypothetical protein
MNGTRGRGRSSSLSEENVLLPLLLLLRARKGGRGCRRC